jgi:hypothetical protein
MQELAVKETYSWDMASTIETMGAVAVSIANRWVMGWPRQVAEMVKSGTYLEHLAAQAEQERAVLANEASMRHLSRHEILQIYEIREAPTVGELIDQGKENHCAFLGYAIEEGAADSVDFGKVLQCAVDYDPTEALADGMCTQNAVSAQEVAC